MALASTRNAPARRAKPQGPGSPGHQAQKSAATRARLIDATIRCLVTYGYARTTTPQVAAEAGLSRGAMLHHFDNGAALIKATITELHERRLRAFRRAAETNEHESAAMVNTYWRQLQKPAFFAFHELAVAARTNAELAAILLPLQVEFRERFNTLAVQLYPEWQGDPKRFALAMAVAQTMMEGMAISLMTGALDATMADPLLRQLERQMQAMRADAARGRDQST